MNEFQNDLLAAHNEHRKKHNMPELTWSDELAEQAQYWANKMANEEKLQHANLEQRQRNGESIAFNSHHTVTGREITDMWYSEIKDFDRNDCSVFNPKTGHFTQVIWRSSTQVGAGIATGSNGKHYACARYNPAGNMKGQFEENLLEDHEISKVDENANIVETTTPTAIKTKEEDLYELFKKHLQNGNVHYKAILSIDGKDDTHVTYRYDEANDKPENNKIYKTIQVTSSHIPKRTTAAYLLRHDAYLQLGKSYQITNSLY